MTPQAAVLWRAAAAVLAVQDYGLPSEFAEKFRSLKPGTSEKPGRWSNDYFPYLPGIMDVVAEAIQTGRRGVVEMKAAQGGGSEAAINCLAWLKAKYSGPILYLISKDEVAHEFGRERFGWLIDTCAPLRAKSLRGKSSGESLGVKRFTDGKIVISGGRSVLNLQSQPYRFVFIDEVDSLMDEIQNQGDPVKIAQTRLDSYSGETLMVVFSHPTNKSRGAARLYYELSDQRRGFVNCVHCAGEFWLQWEHVRPVPAPGQGLALAERDAACWKYFCPLCDKEISDAQRREMVKGVRQKSVLPPEEAAGKTWIGVHFSQLYMPNLSLRLLVEEWIAARDNEAVKIVFQNKRLGDAYEPKVKEVSADQWRRLVCIGSAVDRESWTRGTVPWGVRFLTAGQDSRSTELHWAVWGWGLRRDTAGNTALCGRLIDWGVVERPYSLTLDARELAVFDDLLYARLFPAVYDSERKYHIINGAHDIGWNQIAGLEYCRRNPFRSLPVKGGADTSRSLSPAVRVGAALAYQIGAEKIIDERVRPLWLNTYILKMQLYGMLDQTLEISAGQGLPPRRNPRLALPADIFASADGDRFVYECANEVLVPVSNSKREEFVWKRRGPNHFADCTVYAYAAALNLDPAQGRLSFEEAEAERNKPEPPADAAADEKEKKERTGRDWRIGR